MDMDEEFWQGIDEVEAKVRGGLGWNTAPGGTTSGSGGAPLQAQMDAAPTRRGVPSPNPADIIELEESEEEKENVNARLKRRGHATSREVDTIDLSD
jgi:hypothetical protein